MLDKQKQNQYSKFKDNILGFNPPNTVQPSVSDSLQDLDPNNILDRARLFIHRIKDHRHNKIKAKQIDKFEHFTTKSMDTIVISPSITIPLTTSITTIAVWADNQMCHPVFLLELPHLPPLPTFLPHQGPTHLLPPNVQPHNTSKLQQQQPFQPAYM